MQQFTGVAHERIGVTRHDRDWCVQHVELAQDRARFLRIELLRVGHIRHVPRAAFGEKAFGDLPHAVEYGLMDRFLVDRMGHCLPQQLAIGRVHGERPGFGVDIEMRQAALRHVPRDEFILVIALEVIDVSEIHRVDQVQFTGAQRCQPDLVFLFRIPIQPIEVW